ncbi:hypothetical protein ACOSQ3_007214 [Xanthoceras sorbifolium]
MGHAHECFVTAGRKHARAAAAGRARAWSATSGSCVFSRCSLLVHATCGSRSCSHRSPWARVSRAGRTHAGGVR